MTKLFQSALVLSCALGSQAGVLVGPFVPGTGIWDVLANGGFESGGLSFWTPVIPANGTVTATTAARYGGVYGAEFTPAHNFSGPGFGIAHDAVSVVAGETYVLSGFVKAPTVLSAGGPQFYLDLNDVVNDPGARAMAATPGWQFVWDEWTATFTGNVTPRVVEDGTVLTTDLGYFDDIALTLKSRFVPPTAVPEPGAWGLLGGCGLVVFACVRKTVGR
jgi:hypothetical protein